ncbi:MAG: dihydrofolate reductase family protein [Anaerolineae bacterium]|nr:dihydrofolate reductase family protein [Anaerolineae bacterium]
MRKIVVTEFMALDGVIDTPAWSGPYWNDEISDFKGEEQAGISALLLGRVTYEGFAAAWPESTDEGADLMNNITKYVVSTTLQNPTWNNSHVISGDVAAEIAKLKQQDGGDILVYGSATLVQTLMQHNLIDRYRILMYPVVVGSGKRMFNGDATATLTLLENKTFSGGVIALTYVPQGK